MDVLLCQRISQLQHRLHRSDHDLAVANSLAAAVAFAREVAGVSAQLAQSNGHVPLASRLHVSTAQGGTVPVSGVPPHLYGGRDGNRLRSKAILLLSR